MREIVINTGPVIGLVAATGNLDWLAELYGWKKQDAASLGCTY